MGENTVYSYGTVERILAIVHDIPDEVRPKAFRARIGHLRKLGLPSGPHVGRAIATSYTSDQLRQFAFALQLVEFAVTPTDAVELILRHWEGWDGLKDHTLGWGERKAGGQDVFAVFQPAFLGMELRGKRDHLGIGRQDALGFLETRKLKDESMTIKLVERDEVDGMVSSARRLGVINISDMMRRIADAERQLAHKAGISVTYPDGESG